MDRATNRKIFKIKKYGKGNICAPRAKQGIIPNVSDLLQYDLTDENGVPYDRNRNAIYLITY